MVERAMSGAAPGGVCPVCGAPPKEERAVSGDAPKREYAMSGASQKRELAMFGAGCFWGVEHAFRQVEGVLDVTVGYSGGFARKPTYRSVCSGRTGHAEVVLVEFHPDIVSFEELLEVFWDIHDPTSLNRQGPDVGSQYRSVIFCFDDAQRETAKRSREERQGKLDAEIVTEITGASEFWPAEEHHQRYYEKNGRKCCR